MNHRFDLQTGVVALLACALLVPVAGAQTASEPGAAPAVTAKAGPQGGEPRSPFPGETAEQRTARIGTQEDPGPDPDLTVSWIRFGQEYKIEKYLRRRAAFDQKAGWCRPWASINIPAEIYQENDAWVWVWMPVMAVEAPVQARENENELPYAEYDAEGRKWIEHARPDFQVLTPPDSDKTLSFEEASTGLPTRGSWRNGLDVADMNEDGFVDLIVPPQRGGSTTPSIFLGNGKGEWKLWEGVKWPRGIAYGTTVAGDLNGDGHLDVVAAVHLKGVFAFLGDGKGVFTDASEGLPDNFPTRRAILTDLDHDGDLDIVAISEGATVNESVAVGGRLLRGFRNQKKASYWEDIEIADDKRELSGDWLAAGNLNGDKIPDIVGSSLFFNSADPIYLSEGKNKWSPFGRGFLPFYSYYWSMTIGKFRGRKVDDLVVSFGRTWPTGADPAKIPAPPIKRVLGLDLISFEGKTATRTPIVRWESGKAIWGLGSGDFDGDGRLDLVYWHPQPYEYVFLLGDGRGGFRRAKLEGLVAPNMTQYDIKVADVNGDRKPDLVLMYEPVGSVKDGAIRVFLNRTETVAGAAGTVKK